MDYAGDKPYTNEAGATTLSTYAHDNDATKRAPGVVISGKDTTSPPARAVTSSPSTSDPALPVRPIDASKTQVVANVTMDGQGASYTVIDGYTGVCVSIKGSAGWVGRVRFDGSVDGTNYEPLPMRRTFDGFVSHGTHSDGIWLGNCAGYTVIRVWAYNLSGGTITITLNAVKGPIEHSIGLDKYPEPPPQQEIDDGQYDIIVPVEQASPGTLTIVPANVAAVHEIVGAVGSLSADGRVGFSDGVGTIFGAMPVKQTGGFALANNGRAYARTGAVNRPIQIVTSGGAFGGNVVVRSRPDRGLPHPLPIRGKNYVCVKNWTFGSAAVDAISDTAALTSNFYPYYIYNGGTLNYLTGEVQRYQAFGGTNHVFGTDHLNLHADAMDSAGAGLCKSGMIRSKEAFRYGYFECYMKVPTGTGIFPAFWLNPQDHTWPPEIDIVEIVDNTGNGGTDSTLKSFHHSGDVIHHYPTYQLTDQYGAYIPGYDLSADYHLYSCEWTPKECSWYVDERLVKTIPYFALHPTSGGVTGVWGGFMHVIANLAIGGGWPGAPAVGTVPCDCKVKYIRVWQQRGSPFLYRGG